MRHRIDFNDWRAFASGETFFSPETRFRIKLSAPAALYAVRDGDEPLLIGHGTNFEGECERDQGFIANADGVGYARERFTREATGVPLTNFEKQPMESPLMAEVKKSIRQMKLQERAMKKRIDEATGMMLKARADADLPAPDLIDEADIEGDDQDDDTTPVVDDAQGDDQTKT